jgi:hypothetical protein
MNTKKKHPNYIKAIIGSALLTGLFTCNHASAQISYDTSGSTFTEDFDSGLPSSADTPTWTDNSIFTGWYAYQTATSAAPTEYRITSSGNSSSAQLYQYRESASSDDGSFGTRPSGSTGDMMLGLRLTNNTGTTLTEFTLSYTGEQWFESETEQNNQYVVSYQIGTISDLASGTWTDISELDFNTPSESGADQNLVGSDTENQVTLTATTVGSLVWEDGEDLWIRWYDANSTGYDQGIAIDDVSFSAIPEPSQYATLLGLSALLLTACRRRK